MKEGKTAVFELELSHENVPVTWYKNEIKVHPSRTVFTSVVGRRHTLEIKEVSLDDTCLIKAEAKGISTMAKLLVIGKFTFILPLHFIWSTNLVFPPHFPTIIFAPQQNLLCRVLLIIF